MDREGNIVEESELFGCKVTHDITKLHMVLTFDELGGNTSQKGDGNVGGELLICERGKTPQVKIHVRNKHFTVIGLTTLTGNPAMCVVIFTGKMLNALCETGLDLTVETFGDPSDDDYFEKIQDLASTFLEA